MHPKGVLNKAMPQRKNIVTVIIILLTALFILMGAWTVFKGQQGRTVVSGGPGSPPGGGQQSGAQTTPRQTGGQQGSGQVQRGQQAVNGTAQRAAVTVRATEVVLGTIENSVSVSGDVLAARQVAIYPQTGGRITELRFWVGDRVTRGDVVAWIDPSRPGEVYAASPVVSPITGTILQAPYSTGDTVGTSSAIYAAGDLLSIVVETLIPERFSTSIQRGLRAAASFEALPDETFPMAVSEISPVLDPASRTLRIRLQFQGTLDPRIRAGMYATVSLVTASRANIPVIPRVSLINTYGEWIVFVVDKNNTAYRRAVQTGLENEDIVEITSGLEPGETVVVVGQNFLSDGEPVRVVE
ncbi:MAG: efflux RND transporter periplasmic adaptor subunit [Spirochaetaceae bacterium]|jgi:multidrug efflux pump subunit AcrA (membrane-fusion protein)|nr:efflux RND transporter periplasmic adaptor subunit [Spirochaetaceae bacterium]